MPRLGIIQGRLTPMKNGVIQEFPIDNWKREFPILKEIGFEIIEWVIDEYVVNNPLLDKTMHKEILELSTEFSIEITTVCCDNFMFDSLVSDRIDIRKEAQKLFYYLMNEVCPELEIKYLELPLLNDFGLMKNNIREKYIEFLNEYFKNNTNTSTKILIETDIKPKEIVAFFDKIDSNKVFINYDMGNSAEMEYNPHDEIPVYGHLIKSVHVKDCTPQDYTVPLGEGNVDFDIVFKLLKESGYCGDFILQAARGNDDVITSQAYYTFTKQYIERYYNET